SRQLVSTAGTALLALDGLVVAAVSATPLRIGQVLAAIGGACRLVGLGAVRGARRVGEDVAGFSGEVIRAVLPEKERDEYGEEDEAEEIDAGDSIIGEMAASEPPIIDRSGRLVTGEMAGDTERMDDGVVPALVAQDGGDAAGKKKPRRKKKTRPGLGETVPPGAAEEREAARTEVMEAVAAAPGKGAGSGPGIVEPAFRHPKKEEMKAKEEKVDASRHGFIPLGDGEFQLPPVNILDYDESQAVSMDRAAMLEMSAKLI